MILTEGELTYELNFPFSEFEKAYFYEKRSQFFQGSQDEENQGFEDNKTDENAKSFGPKIALKNQRVALKNATLLQSGWRLRAVSELKNNYYFNEGYLFFKIDASLAYCFSLKFANIFC